MPAADPPRFYRGDLPPRPAHLELVKRVLGRGPATRQELMRRTQLTQTQVLCAIDALISAGEVSYDTSARAFAAVVRA